MSFLGGLIGLGILIFGALFLRVILTYLGRQLHYKRLMWVFAGYCTILVLSLVVLSMLPAENFLKEKMLSKKELERATWVNMNFHKIIEEGKFDPANGIYINGQWSFDYHGNQLEIVVSDNFSPWILAERKDIDDGEIEVVNYTQKSIFEGMDITNRINSPKITLKGNQLQITGPDGKEVEFIRFDRDFATKQFVVRNEDSEINGLGSFMLNQVLYLRIPKSLQFENENLSIQFVNSGS